MVVHEKFASQSLQNKLASFALYRIGWCIVCDGGRNGVMAISTVPDRVTRSSNSVGIVSY